MRTIHLQTVNQMKKLFGFSLIFIVLAFTLLQPTKSAAMGESQENSYLLRSTVQYSNPTKANVWDFALNEEDRTVNLFMNNSWQTVKLLNSTFPVEAVRNDSDGNSIAVLQFPQTVLSPGENLSFVVWYQITTWPRSIPNISENASGELDGIESALVSDYTKEEGSWQTDNPVLRQLAFNLRGNETKVLSIVKSFVAWMEKNVLYPKTQHEVPYYPSETYSKLEGDCDDQAILLVALCRIVGIPAYLQIGSIYLPNEPKQEFSYWSNHVTYVQRYIGWHGWAMVYVPPWGWLPADLTYILQDREDPLNAIKRGAITEPTAVQYENVAHEDYVASSLEARSFLTLHGFEVYAEDEMLPGSGQRAPEPKIVVEPLLSWILPVFAIAIVVAIVIGAMSIYIARKRNRRGLNSSSAAQQSKMYV